MYAQPIAWLAGHCERLLPSLNAVLDTVEACDINDAVDDTDNVGQARDVFSWIWSVF